MPKPSSTITHVLEGKTDHTAGDYETTILPIPQSISNTELQLTNHNWPSHPETVIKAQLWVSYDSGRKWHFLVGFEALGGTSDSISSVRRKLKPQYKTHIRLLKSLITCKIPLTLETKIEVW